MSLRENLSNMTTTSCGGHILKDYPQVNVNTKYPKRWKKTVENFSEYQA